MSIELPELPANRLPLGKHQGWLTAEVALFCPKYLIWLLEVDKLDPFPEQKAETQRLLHALGDRVERDLFLLKDVFLRKADREKIPVDILEIGDKNYYVHTRRQVYRVVRPSKKSLEALEEFLELYPSEDESVYRQYETQLRKYKEAAHARDVALGLAKPKPVSETEMRRALLRLNSPLKAPPSEKMRRYLEKTAETRKTIPHRK